MEEKETTAGHLSPFNLSLGGVFDLWKSSLIFYTFLRLARLQYLTHQFSLLYSSVENDVDAVETE